MLNEFWLGIMTEFSMISEMVLNILLTFWSKYFCRAAFSGLAITKSKYQSIPKFIEDVLHTPVPNIQSMLFVCIKINKPSLTMKIVFNH